MSRYIEYEPLMAELEREVELADDWKTAHEIANVVKYAPTIEVPQWIPCSEMLPEENEEVLVCDEDGTMEVCGIEMFGRGIGLKWTDKNGYECWLDVVAWMPLPQPYKETDHE